MALLAAHLDAHRRPAGGVGQRERGAGLAGEVAVAPLHERQGHRRQVPTHVGERVWLAVAGFALVAAAAAIGMTPRGKQAAQPVRAPLAADAA